MTELLTAAQMRRIERDAIDSGTVTGLELMERAGRGVVNAVFQKWPELAATAHRAVVLCGPGNNGGDGFVVTRLLSEWGWEVEAYLYGDGEKLPPDAKVNYKRLKGAVAAFEKFDPRSELPADLYVDALFGTGFTRPLRGKAREIVQALVDVAVPGRQVAIDIPTGLHTDTGDILEIAWPADLTVTFHHAKLGHFIGQGPETCGEVTVKDIGLNDDMTAMREADRTALVRVCERPGPDELGKKSGNHKYDYGHALILSGGVGRGGAARMAARGALRIGAGAVTLGCPPAALIENAAQLDAIMLRSLKDAETLATVLEDTRLNAVCIGPGLGTTARDAVLVATVLGRGDVERRPTVLDADALTILANDTSIFDMLHARCVLTPHGGEFRRLFPDIADKLAADPASGHACSKVDATREAAAGAGCVVLFKGSDTVIAAPDGRCSINSAQYDRAAPWLATAGAGDVLAGFMTGLLARGFAPMRAAEIAAWLHVGCALGYGPGLIAEDLPEELPQVFRRLGV